MESRRVYIHIFFLLTVINREASLDYVLFRCKAPRKGLDHERLEV